MSTEAKNSNPIERNSKKTLDEPISPTKRSLTSTVLPDESQAATAILSSMKHSSVETVRTNGAQNEGKESKNGDSDGTEAPAVSSPLSNSDGQPVTDIQKKIRRAERFGMSVQLSEEEKRSSRAERFGTGSTLHGSDALKKSEEQKRKARAERFGLPAEPVPADEDSKKKARLARFAQVSKTDSVEEDKRKARAIRFSVPASSSLPQVNVKGDVDLVSVLGKSSGV